MKHIMKLADDYASALVEERTDDCKGTAEEVVGRLEKVIATRTALQSAIEKLQFKLEAANQLAQLNAEIGISLKDDREVLAAKLEIERKNRQAAQIENEALKTRLAKVIK